MKTEQDNECVKNLVLPTGTTAIKDNEFRDCLDLERDVILEGVTEIGLFTFEDCANKRYGMVVGLN